MNDEMKKCDSCGCNCGNCSADGKTCGGHCACSCVHHKIVPGMIVLIAITFLLSAFNVITPELANILWPIFLLIAGGTKFKEGSCTCC